MTAPERSKDELIRLWESGVPLDFAWRKFTGSLDDFALDALHLKPEDDLKVFGVDNPRYKELIKEGWLPSTLEGRKKTLEIITQNARTYLFRDIYTGRLWAVGFRTLPGGLVEPTPVPQELFFDEGGHPELHRTVDWSDCAIKAGDDSFFDIRVTRPPLGSHLLAPSTITQVTNPSEVSNAAVTQGTSSPNGQALSRASSQERNAPGRPSKASVILAAIAEHAKTDLHLERPRPERYRNYRSYARSQGYDPHRDAGFSDKTFEKYEREFRNKTK
jgi:hypothetical protein